MKNPSSNYIIQAGSSSSMAKPAALLHFDCSSMVERLVVSQEVADSSSVSQPRFRITTSRFAGGVSRNNPAASVSITRMLTMLGTKPGPMDSLGSFLHLLA